MQDARQRVADGGQTSVPWRLSRSVIDSLGPAGAEFARIADSVRCARVSITAVSVCRWSTHGGFRCQQSVLS